MILWVWISIIRGFFKKCDFLDNYVDSSVRQICISGRSYRIPFWRHTFGQWSYGARTSSYNFFVFAYKTPLQCWCSAVFIELFFCGSLQFSPYFPSLTSSALWTAFSANSCHFYPFLCWRRTGARWAGIKVCIFWGVERAGCVFCWVIRDVGLNWCFFPATASI